MSSPNSIRLRREVYTDDVEQMVEWMADEEVTQYLNEKSDMSERLEKLLAQSQLDVMTQHFNHDSRFYLVDLKEEEEPIGYLRLIPKKKDKTEIVIAIADKEKWNNGYGTKAVWAGLKEAFFNLRSEKVEAKIHDENKASRKVFQKVGFEEKEVNTDPKVYQLTLDEFLQSIV